ncbi:MAG: hypothetical protein PHS97_00100 [Oscillospiraceae bacterium]|nr:hypothetical protein [Oscillospiraceae bacterium]
MHHQRKITYWIIALICFAFGVSDFLQASVASNPTGGSLTLLLAAAWMVFGAREIWFFIKDHKRK